MSISLFAYSIACVIYIIIGIHTYNADRKSKANRLFLVTSSTLAFWAFCLVLMSATNNPSVAANYRWITIIASSCLYVEILNFVLIITGKNKYSTKLWFRILIYTPAVINFYIYFFNPIPAEYMLKITGTWAYMHPLGRGFIFDYYFTAYYSIYAIIATILLIRHSKKAKFLRERKQSRLMYISFIVVAIITTFTTVILPMLGYLRMPPLTTIVSLISVFGVWYSLKKYSMMNLSGDTLLLEVSQIMYEGIIIFDNQDHIIRINKGTEELLGCSMTDCADSSAIKNLFPSEIWEFNITHQGFECNINTLYETSLPVMLSVHILKDNFDEKSGTVLYFQDLTQIKDANAALAEERNKLEVRVSERTLSLKTANKQLAEEIELRIAKEKEIEKLAFRDHLTGLPNRRMFSDTLEKEIKKSLRTKMSLAVLFLDLDGFKNINDSLGHSCGDMMLIQVAERLKALLRQSDMVARLGGDEFAILLFHPDDNDAIISICNYIIRRIEEPYYILNTEAHVSVSIGISICPQDGRDSDQLLKCSDIAMYDSKDNGKGQFSFFDKNKIAGLAQTMRLTNDLYHALEKNELEVYYQPQVTVDTKEIIGFEALLRWNHYELGLVYPDDFIEIAERTGLIINIGKWVLSVACSQLKLWNEKYKKRMKMAVNISIKQLEDGNIKENIIDVIKDTGIDPCLIELEITEGTLMKNIENTVDIVNNLKEQGIRIAIDDFGTEYSSLNYIKHLAISRIKISKDFIDGINENKSDESIISSTIMLAKELGLDVVAEGVEHELQYQYLKDNVCDIIQGFLFYKPMPVSQIEKELTVNKSMSD